FRAIVVGLVAELLDGIRIGQDIGHFRVRVFMNAAIHHERGGVAAAAGSRDELAARFGPRGRLVERSAGAERAGSDAEKLQDVAAIEGQVRHHLVVHDGIERGVLCVDGGDLSDDADRFAYRADLELQVGSRVLVHLKIELGNAGGRKSFFGGRNRVWAGRQGRDRVVAGVIRGNGSRESGGQTLGCDSGSGNRGSRGVGDQSGDRGGLSLREEVEGGKR